MELFANITNLGVHPGEFARQREADGFDGVTCSDHFWLGSRELHGCPHVFVSLATMAASTQRVKVAPSFANNLFRHPYEFAQASLTLQLHSGGRYEAGLGAGWMQDECDRAGLPYPAGPQRARRYREAVQIVRELFDNGSCTFEGEHYKVDLPVIGPLTDPRPPLVVSVGGPWTMKHVTPLADRVELKMGASTHGGALDFKTLGAVQADEVRRMVGTVQEAKPGVPTAMIAFIAIGEGPAVDAMRGLLGDDGLYGSFCGEAKAVADRLRALEDLGIDRLQLTEWVPGSIDALTPELL